MNKNIFCFVDNSVNFRDAVLQPHLHNHANFKVNFICCLGEYILVGIKNLNTRLFSDAWKVRKLIKRVKSIFATLM